MFRLLAAPDIPKRAMWSGALLGAVGFEILKQVSGLLIRATQNQPAFQVFGLALILLVWINYFSRVILYAASWAWTHPLAREQRVVEPAEPVQGPPLPSVDERCRRDEQPRSRRAPSWPAPRSARPPRPPSRAPAAATTPDRGSRYCSGSALGSCWSMARRAWSWIRRPKTRVKSTLTRRLASTTPPAMVAICPTPSGLFDTSPIR